MMFKKKTVFFRVVCVLTVFFMLSTLFVGATENELKFEQKDMAKAALLHGLGIISEKPEEFLSKTQLTRGEFAEIAVKMSMEYDDTVSTEKLYFTDVDDEHPNSGAIYAAVSLGLMVGNGDYTFAPDRAVSYEELSKILVKLVGYKWLAELNGGYMPGYLSTAQKIGLADGVSTGNMDGVNIARILCNALEAEYPVVSGIGKDVTYETDENRTFMTEVLKVVKVNGVVEATAETELYGESNLDKDEIKVNGNVFRYENGGQSLLGKMVDVYYRTNRDAAAVKNVLFVSVSDKYDVLEIEGKDAEYSNKVFTYYDSSDKEKTARIADDAAIIFNGTAIDDPAFDMNSLAPENGNVVLIENSGDKIFDVVIVRSYYNVKIDSVGGVDDVIYDGSAARNNVEIKNMDNWRFFDKNGKEISFSELTIGSVASVEENSKGGNVYIGQDAVMGKVEKAYEDRIVINGTEYDLCNSIFNDNEFVPVAGDYGRFLRDRTGKIAFFDKINSDLLAGILISAGRERGFNGKLKANIYTIVGESKAFDFADRVEVDGKVYRTDKSSFGEETDEITEYLHKSAALENPVLTNDFPLAQLIRYKTDNENKICEIDTTLVNNGYEDENTLRTVLKYSDGVGAYYKKRGMCFSGKALVDANTITFVVNTPVQGNIDDNFQLSSGAYFSDNYTYDIAAFNYTRDKIVADVVIVYKDSSTPELVGEALEMLVDSTGAVYTDEGETLRTVSGYYLGSYTTFKLSSNLVLEREPQQGDLIRFSTNSREEIYVIETVYYGPENKFGYDANKDGNPDLNNGAGVDTSEYITQGYAYHTYGNSITVAPTLSVSGVEEATRESYSTAEAKVYIYDRNNTRNPVSVGSAKDIRTYLKDKDAASKIIVRTLFTSVVTILIIK